MNTKQRCHLSCALLDSFLKASYRHTFCSKSTSSDRHRSGRSLYHTRSSLNHTRLAVTQVARQPSSDTSQLHTPANCAPCKTPRLQPLNRLLTSDKRIFIYAGANFSAENPQKHCTARLCLPTCKARPSNSRRPIAGCLASGCVWS